MSMARAASASVVDVSRARVNCSAVVVGAPHLVGTRQQPSHGQQAEQDRSAGEGEVGSGSHR